MSSQERYEAPHGAFSRRLVSGCIPAGSLAKWGACARRFLYFKLTVARSACLWPPTVKVGKADDIVKQMARGGPRSPGSIPGRVLRRPCRRTTKKIALLLSSRLHVNRRPPAGGHHCALLSAALTSGRRPGCTETMQFASGRFSAQNLARGGGGASFKTPLGHLAPHKAD